MKPAYMLPSDTRLASWDPANYIISTTVIDGFPGYIWKDINNDHLVYFRLTTAQLTSGAKIRFGVTERQQGGRPSVSVKH
jgi:rhamnogalacturonan endolyase